MAVITCPLCKKECTPASRTLVYSNIKKYFKQHVKAEEYGFCKNENCDIVYFGLNNDEMYFKRDFDEEIK